MSKTLYYTGAVGIVSYLLWGTGFVSDDFADLVLLKSMKFPDFLVPRHNFINVPVGHFTHHIWFRYFEVGGHLIDLAKIFWTCLSLLLIFRFFRRFHEQDTSVLITFFFAFYPSHDSIPFWYAPSGHLIALGIYFEAYSQCWEGRNKLAALLALLASFMVYSSTPVALSLGLLCLLQKEAKRFWVLVTPNLVYVAYFLGVSHFAQIAPSRFLEPLNGLALLKNLLLQVLTFCDALIGPAFFFKLYYSICEIKPHSVVVGICICVALCRTQGGHRVGLNTELLFSFATLAALSWIMFSFTGRYPQLAFNLGNRTTFWGSLLISYVLLATPAPRWMRMSGIAVLMFSILGISDHWRQWQTHQIRVLTQIKENQELEGVATDELVLVTGNQYSHLGPFAHLEFLSEDWVVSNIFKLAGRTCKRGLPLNKHKFIENGRFQSRKKNRATWKLKTMVWVYDSESDKLRLVHSEELNDLIANLELPRRHWSQLDTNLITTKAKAIVYFLMPRLRGALPHESKPRSQTSPITTLSSLNGTKDEPNESSGRTKIR